MDKVEIVRLTAESCVKLGENNALALLREIHALHVEIHRDEGQVAARLDEAETFVERRLETVRGLRREISEKQRQMRQKCDALQKVIG